MADNLDFKPKVSVLMPFYNSASYIGEAVDSILAQSFTDFELLLINDGSTDESQKIVRSYDDKRIRLADNEKNMGLAYSRNRALAMARGDYVAWLDSDDKSHISRLEKQVRLLDSDPALIMCGTWVKTIGETNGTVWKYPVDSSNIKSRMIFDDPFATSSIMMKKEVVLKNKFEFRQNFQPAEDYDLWERLSSLGRGANIPEILTYYRLHKDQSVVLMSKQQIKAVWEIQERQLKALGIIPDDDEKSLHLQIGAGWSSGKAIDFLESARKWLEKLALANSDQKIFPEKEFLATLAERWFMVCNLSTEIGFKSFSLFKNSMLYKNRTLSPAGLLIFLLKALSKSKG